MTNTQQPQQVVIANAAQVEQWKNAIGTTLHQVYQTAEANGDNNTMVLVSQAWDKTQELAQLSIANASAGAAAIQQRDAAMTELNELIAAINNLDEEHPKLEEFAVCIREEEQAYAYEIMDEHVYELVDEALYEIIASDEELADHKAWRVAHKIADAITGFKKLDEEQKEALLAFARTLV